MKDEGCFEGATRALAGLTPVTQSVLGLCPLRHPCTLNLRPDANGARVESESAAWAG